MKNYYIISFFVFLIIFLSSCTKTNSLDDTCLIACSKITPVSTAPIISTDELEGGMYYGNLIQKKIGTPNNWVHTQEGTKSSSWRSPESGKNYECDCDKP